MNRALLVAAMVCACGGANADPVTRSLEIRLQDPSTDPSVEHMRIVIDREAIQPGRVTLHAVNESKSTVHEVVVARDDGAAELPLNANRDRVIEARIRTLGEIANLAPGASGSLTLVLERGAYVLFCNLPGHYPDGMAVKLVVGP